MSEKYAPGTVVEITYFGKGPRRAVVRPRRESFGMEFAYFDGGWDPASDEAVAASAHPLVVLDLPDRRRTHANLTAAIHACGGPASQVGGWLKELRDQIEEQARPPKPEEPTGLGAVVEDTHGVRYVRTEDAHAPWLGGRYVPSVGLRKAWGDFDADEVLSEGVQS